MAIVPSRKESQPNASCFAMAACSPGKLEWNKGKLSCDFHESSLSLTAWMIAGAVSSLPSARANISTDRVQVLIASGSLHRHTCLVVSGCPHLGQWSLGRNRHRSAILPTEHHPEVCLTT